MSKILQAILEHLPRRRRRFWRYVSPQRRGVAWLVLALLLTVLYGYWYLTNDARIAAQAERYLHKITGCDVTIRSATFRLFGGIELDDVRVRIPGDESAEPFFQARQVLLDHRPWALVLRQRLEPVEIFCVEPIVTLTRDAETGQHTIRKFLAAQPERMEFLQAGDWPKPALIARDLLLRQPAGEMGMHLSVLPAGGWTYTVSFEADRPGGKGPIFWSFRYDVDTGAFTSLEGEVPELARLDRALPAEYRRFRERYNIRGMARLKRQAATAPDGGGVEVELVDVSLTLPPDEGGLELTGVRGTLRFGSQGLTLHDITGRISQAGDAKFTLSGRYNEYTTDSPFRVEATITGMSVPDGKGIEGEASEHFRKFHRRLQPDGKLDLSVTVERKEGEAATYRGEARPRGMSLVYAFFPCAVENVTGTVAFSQKGIELRELTGRRHGGTVRLTGTVRGDLDYDVTIRGADIRLDEELGRAMPESMGDIWQMLQPTGTMGEVVAHVRRAGKEARELIDVDLSLDGRASMAHRAFPYRVEQLRGQVTFSGEKVQISHLHGRRGPMDCTLVGTVDNVSSKTPDVDLTVTARKMPLDKTLADALDAPSRRAFETLHPTGVAETVTAYLKQSEGKELTYDITANLKGVSIRPDDFPYTITDAAGVMTVLPGRIGIRDLQGRHGKTPVTLRRGEVLTSGGTFGLDLKEIVATNVALDRDLYAALPPHLKEVWKSLKPGGTADITLALRQGLGGQEGKTDYRLEVDARGMSVTWEHFPYPFTGITGRIVAEPGRVVLNGVTATAGKMKAVVDGTVTVEARGERADLTVTAQAMPIDEKFLAAMPDELADFIGRLKPGGTCDIRKLALRFAPPAPAPATQPAQAAPTTQPTTGPATKPATQPATTRPQAPPALWNAKGELAFHDALINIGPGHRRFTGSITGSAGRTSEGLAVDAAIALAKVQVGPKNIHNLRGRIVKSPRSNLIRVDDMTGSLHGGRLAGQAEVRLVSPPQYGVSLSLENLKIEDLFEGDAKDKPDVRGLLTGNIQLTGTAGKTETVRATGVMRITKAKMYKLPVVLGMLNVIYLALPGNVAFTEGQVTYRLIGEKLIFDEIYLTGPALSIVGSGTMSTATEKIKLTFLAGPPGKLPRIAGLEELLKPIFRQLIEHEVTGTLSEPRMRTVPLRGLDEAIRKLLSPGQP